MKNELYLGDCVSCIENIPNKSVDFILTDIPFNISQANNFKTMKDRKGRNGIDFGEWDKGFDESCLITLLPKLKDNGGLLTFHSFEQFSLLKEMMESNGMVFKDKIIWEKTNPMPRNRDRRYISNIEIASWFVVKGAKWTFNRTNSNYDGSVMRYPSESGGGFKRYHPCQKNAKMLEELILRHTNEGDIILDPFMGGGSTGVACVHTNRNFIGIELDENYFNIAKERIDKCVEDKNV